MKSKLHILIAIMALVVAVPVSAETLTTDIHANATSTVKDTMNQNIQLNEDGKSTFVPDDAPRGTDSSDSTNEGKMYKGSISNVKMEDLGEIKNPTPEPELTSAHEDESYDITVDSSATRDMTDIARKDFIAHLKNDTELSTTADLENYAKAITVLDENVKDIKADNEHIDVAYSMPAKFLGLFGSSMSTHTLVSFNNNSSGSATYTVEVTYPWYAFLFNVNSDAKSDAVKKLVETNLARQYRDEIGVTRSGKAIKIVSDVLKATRAKVSTSADVDSTATVSE